VLGGGARILPICGDHVPGKSFRIRNSFLPVY
jgi:hypothetical protein